MSASAGAYHAQGARRPGPFAFAPAVVLLAAAALRLAGLDWDGGGLFHPDERRILMVVSQLQWPEAWDWPLVLSPQSPLNPRFFSYGSLPLYMLRLAQALFGWPVSNLYALGRFFSAGADILTTAIVLALGRRLAGRRAGHLAAGFYALAVLPLQLSHFATVDTLLVLFSTLALSCLVTVAQRGSRRAGVLAGVVSVWIVAFHPATRSISFLWHNVLGMAVAVGVGILVSLVAGAPGRRVVPAGSPAPGGSP